MNLIQKREILTAYFKAHGGIPNGCITVNDTAPSVCNISVNDTFYGVFDFEKRDFIEGSVEGYAC